MTPWPSALFTDRYELTMLDAALHTGAADRQAVFEVFTRRLPPGRHYGVFAGLGRLLDRLEEFRFGPEELDWLASQRVVSESTLAWLADYRFAGRIDAYAEGELYTGGSPVVTVEGRFGEAILLETLVLSVLNHDSAVAAAAELIVRAAAGRPVIEMGSRRTDPDAALAAARAAYVAGFDATSNLEAGRRYAIPTAGTAAHAFVLLYPTEREAFAAQVGTLGSGTTLLVDTYDSDEGIRTAIDVAGRQLGAIRIDSGDLAGEAWRARRLLDALGATGTRIVATGDLDDRSIAALSTAPVDGYGVGTSVVTGLGQPTAGFVYKLVAIGDEAGEIRAVAKRSPGKGTIGGRKWAWRAPYDELAHGAGAGSSTAAPVSTGSVMADVLRAAPGPAPSASRPLQQRVVEDGRVVVRPTLVEIRARHRSARCDVAGGVPLVLVREG